jgi:MurNAc alpha-1-phosphate uridylyltransferase
MRHALIFAAGLGERMRPLTERTPKPLLVAGGKPLIVWHLEKLAAIGVNYVVINTSHLAKQFPDTLGDGARWGLRIRYAYEGPAPLETGGGMLNALPLLGAEPFIAVNGDIWTDFDFARLPIAPRAAAQLVMVDNPAHHPTGDFVLDDNGQLHADGPGERLTFAGIGVYRRSLLDGWQQTLPPLPHDGNKPARFALAPLLRAQMAKGAVDGIHHRGAWTDVGTPQRLQQLDGRLDGRAGSASR